MRPTTPPASFLPFTPAVPALLLACTAGPVPVHHEPRHQPVYEGEAFRVLDVRLPPGDTSQLHRHANDIFYAVIDGSNIFAHPVGGEPVHVYWPAGHLSDNTTHRPDPAVHRVGNDGPSPFRLVAVENLTELAARRPDPIATLGAAAVDDERFGGYRLPLAPGDSVPVHTHQRPVVVVQISPGEAEHEGHTHRGGTGPGAWWTVAPGTAHAARNPGADSLVVAEIEIR